MRDQAAAQASIGNPGICKTRGKPLGKIRKQVLLSEAIVAKISAIAVEKACAALKTGLKLAGRKNCLEILSGRE